MPADDPKSVAVQLLGTGDAALCICPPDSAEHVFQCPLSYRPCLAFIEPARRQCREPALWVCCNEDRMQWFACDEHAATHAFVRVRLVKFLSLVHSGVGIPQTAWEASPMASPAVREAVGGHHVV
jgi:hypothetical protein